MEDLVNTPSAAFWSDRQVLLTGHTGFKGSWLALWLHRMGARVTGLALPPDTTPNLFTAARIGSTLDSRLGDIRDGEAVAKQVREVRPDIVFHLAAQALVRPAYREPVDTFARNVMGTVHVLEAMRGIGSVRVAVMITTDKVYHNREWPYPYREEDALGGHDPYSASKAACELAIASYRASYLRDQGVAVASARAGNVIGGGDWSLDRLVPDAVRAWSAGVTLDVRRPHAIRPWQHVLDPLSGYLVLAERLWHDPGLADAYNFGPSPHSAATVRQVIDRARAAFGHGDVRYGDGQEGPHEAGRLALETARTRSRLGVEPRWPLAVAVDRTMGWYKAVGEGGDARALCAADLQAFEAMARTPGGNTEPTK